MLINIIIIIAMTMISHIIIIIAHSQGMYVIKA